MAVDILRTLHCDIEYTSNDRPTIRGHKRNVEQWRKKTKRIANHWQIEWREKEGKTKEKNWAAN